MIEDTINKIEQRLRSSENLPPDKRAELESLLAELRTEIATLPGVQEQTRDDSDDDDLLHKLNQSVTEFETTHPQLIGIVNRISTILANMGI
jgi:mannitol-1-phosphate/altronate dehydrogenase